MLDRFRNSNVLLLQGPIGPFFRRLARDLTALGANVTKVAFNAGDALFYLGTGYVPYRGSLDDWPAFVDQLIEERQIDTALLLGDLRPYHVAAKQVLERRGVAVFVFEEGYLRPNYITLEPDGVNGNSRMSKDASFYLEADCDPAGDEEPVDHTFAKSALLTAYYYVAFNFLFFRYPHYRHYRDANVVKHALSWVRSGVRKLKYQRAEAGLLERIESELTGRYFFVPLQVWNDFQWQHSPFDDIDALLEHIFGSFAAHADPQHSLVVKHHIADRGYRDYAKLIREKAERLRIGDRVIYVHDLHLPTLLKHARGTVVMNSTVGLSSLHHGTPIKVLGDAIYDVPPLSFGGSLDEFWQQAGELDRELYRKFRGWLEQHNQFNGNFYGRLPDTGYETGVRWK